MAIVPVGADGKIDIHGSWGNTSETVDVDGDVVGYFSAGTSGQTYHAIAGTRMNETVAGNFTIYPAGTSMPGTSNLNFQSGLGPINNLDLAATGGGTFDIYNGSSGTIGIVVDFTGYLSAG
jgi:hypothetical protein